MDKKEFVDLGTINYGDYPHVLKAKIEKVCNNYFPDYLPNEIVLEIFHKHYATKRSESGLVKMIEKLKDEALLAKPKLCQPEKKSQKIILIPDGCQRGTFENCFNHKPNTIRKEYRDNLWKSFFKDDFKSIWYVNHHSQSTIRFMEGEHNYFIFYFPRIVDADYALIFKEIFSLQKNEIGYNRSSESKLQEKNISKEKFSECEHALFNIGKREEAKDLDLSGFTNLEKERIHQCTSYLLDFILGYLATDCDSEKITPGDKEKDASERRRESIQKKLVKLAKTMNYHPSKNIAEDALVRVGDASLKEGAERKGLRKVLYFIADNCTKKRLSLPEFYIYIPRMLELYCYAAMKKSYPDLRLKAPLKDQKNDKFYYPDMTLEYNGRTIFFDAKNKTEYVNSKADWRDDYDGIKFYIDTSKKKNNMGIILYPDMGGESLEEIIKVAEEPLPEKRISKRGFRLPVKGK